MQGGVNITSIIFACNRFIGESNPYQKHVLGETFIHNHFVIMFGDAS